MGRAPAPGPDPALVREVLETLQRQQEELERQKAQPKPTPRTE